MNLITNEPTNYPDYAVVAILGGFDTYRFIPMPHWRRIAAGLNFDPFGPFCDRMVLEGGSSYFFLGVLCGWRAAQRGAGDPAALEDPAISPVRIRSSRFVPICESARDARCPVALQRVVVDCSWFFFLS